MEQTSPSFRKPGNRKHSNPGASGNPDNHRMQRRRDRLPVLLAAGAAALLLISLVPILAVSFYAHPLVDDFGYSAYVHQAVSGGGSLYDILAAALTKVAEVYGSWQGTFAAVFLFTLQPGAFGENLYFLTTFLLIAALTGATFYLIDTIAVRLLRCRRAWSVLISAALLFVEIQFVPDKKEAFYWYNGAVYYTVFYALTLVLTALTIRMFLTSLWRRKVLYCGAACLLAIAVGGGNYSTALFAALLSALVPFAAYVLLRADGRKPHLPRREVVLYCLIPCCLLISFAVSAAAPGNAVRGASMEGMPAPKAVIMSVYYAARYAGNWTGMAQAALLCGLTPVLWHLAGKTEFSFPYPVLTILAAFLCYAAMYTPALYAMSSVGSGRQIDIYYYTYFLAVLFSVFYLCGWARHRGLAALDEGRVTQLPVLWCGAALLAALFISGCASCGFSSLTSVDTALALWDGTAAQYDAEYRAAIEQITAGEPYVEEVQTVPDFFGTMELYSEYSRTRMAQYYGVDDFEMAQ